MSEGKLILDYVYDHEARSPGRVYLTQPLGGGAVDCPAEPTCPR